MKRYPAYKDSGVTWIDEVPENWEMKRIKHLVDLIIEKAENSSESPFKIALENIESFTGKYLNGSGSFEGAGNFFKQDDVLFNKLRPYLAKVFIAASDGVAVGELLVLRPKPKTDKAFLFFRLLSKSFISVVDGSTYGAKMPRANWELVGNLKVPVPDSSSQRFIARYLDHKTHLIDTLIEKKQKQIELLQEQRAAIINQAVTKGLNPNVKLKDSGIEWLGEVPEYWERIQLKRVFSRIDYGISDNLSGDGEIKVLTMGHIQNGTVIIPEDGCISDVDPELLLLYHDLLFNRTNSRDLVAKVGIYKNSTDEKVTFASYLVRFRVNEDNDAEFMNYLLNSQDFISYARSLALHSINQSNLNSTKYSQIVVYLPPKKEQIKIAQYLENRCVAIEGVIHKENKQIEHLKEYRTTLISEVVTGKIDVRDEAIP